jgi:oligopeptide/dipeptide ABC transporter ATP-binding protein
VVREGRERILLEGDPPSPLDLLPGCRFFGRCPWRSPHCEREDPMLREVSPGHFVACHLHNQRSYNA